MTPERRDGSLVQKRCRKARHWRGTKAASAPAGAAVDRLPARGRRPVQAVAARGAARDPGHEVRVPCITALLRQPAPIRVLCRLEQRQIDEWLVRRRVYV